MRIRWQLSILFTILSLTALNGCNKDQAPRPSQGTLDNPSFHVMRGKDLLDEQRINAASKQFDLALELKSDYAPGLAGKALVLTLQSQQLGLEPENAAESYSDNVYMKAETPMCPEVLLVMFKPKPNTSSRPRLLFRFIRPCLFSNHPTDCRKILLRT